MRAHPGARYRRDAANSQDPGHSRYGQARGNLMSASRSEADVSDLFRAHGFEADGQFGSAISFTRDLNADYRDLIDGTPPEIRDLYDVRVAGDRAMLTFDVLNVRFMASAA